MFLEYSIDFGYLGFFDFSTLLKALCLKIVFYEIGVVFFVFFCLLNKLQKSAG